VDDSTRLEITAGRHPVVERLLEHQFIANDTFLDSNAEVGPPVPSSALPASSLPQIVILTGPNMAGKSTYLRQVALIAIMAQTGSFVPAAKAHIGVVDKIFTRIGASDDLARGVSTFLAEMTETANILNNATTRSLVILDEIGRGTATGDGLAIAWATVEYLHGGGDMTDSRPGKSDRVPSRPKTLFATHYHELCDIVTLLPRCKNYSFTVREQRGEVLFMRKLKEGPADKSYGIAVAKLAGLPREVIERAKQVLADFEKGERLSIGQLAPESDLALAADRPPAESNVQRPESSVLSELKSADVEDLTPLAAFELLLRLKKQLQDQPGD
jgi:DNA mismatch repair protein MutS